ncbi:hydrolase [Streptomyces camponoticapitis]|uniref:Hydrolase n=1 Tax=Streptomyces camponoticapitis TaxID=1616125 RepID=A0ABQ2EUB0_9ACTN|nr:CocE/NonD family hydrolase [Streptomyces camponoticapitis]GGK25053.1 hydrolase [Streptomyces camponoticapitis]
MGLRPARIEVFILKATPGLTARAVDRLLRRLRKLPAPRNEYAVVRGLRTPTRDGFVLVSDHYSPVVSGSDSATILIRTPYGRGLPVDALWARTFAARGYHVILQSVRGTVDSTGTFEPMVREAEDAQDTIVWLREQSWFNGKLATLGMSYLAFTQWALLADPPPELRASVMIAGPHDFSRVIWDNGSFALEAMLGWSAVNSVSFEDRPSLFRQLVGNKQSTNRLVASFAGLPLARAAESVLDKRAPWFQEWLDHTDLTDPYWRPYNYTGAVQHVRTPTLLVGGWQDVFVGQTVEQYEALRSRGVDVALTLGPWTHAGHVTKGSGVIDNEALDWLDTHLGNDGPARRAQPVHTFVTGSDTWHTSPIWPPTCTETSWYPNSAGQLTATVPSGGESAFSYDPGDPTPSVGGRRLTGDAGVRNNSDLEARQDVRTFTTLPLTADLEFEGFPVVDVSLSLDNPHADLFVRICDVDVKGRSHNIADVLVRLDPTADAGQVQHVTARLSPCAHRLLKGHRLRLQLSGGAHPQYARNLGTGEPLSTGTGLNAAVHTIHHDSTRLTLPVTSTGTTRPS